MVAPVAGISIVICLGVLATSGCSKPAPAAAAPQPDPWQAKLSAWQNEYESNEAKLLADWPAAFRQAKVGDLDANKLVQEIDDFSHELNDQREKLEQWNRELAEELKRRGITSKDRANAS